MPKNSDDIESISSIINRIKKVMPSSSAVALSPKKEKALAQLIAQLPDKLDRDTNIHALLTDKTPNKHHKNFWRAFIYILAQKPGWRQPAILEQLNFNLRTTANTPANIAKQQANLTKEIKALSELKGESILEPSVPKHGRGAASSSGTPAPQEKAQEIISECLSGKPLDQVLKDMGEIRPGSLTKKSALKKTDNWVQTVHHYLVDGLKRAREEFIHQLIALVEDSDLFRAMNIDEAKVLLSKTEANTEENLLIAIAFNQANPLIRQIDTSSLSADEQARYAECAQYYQQQRNIRFESAEKPIIAALEVLVLAQGWKDLSGAQLAAALLKEKDALKEHLASLPNTTLKNLPFFSPDTTIHGKQYHSWQQLTLLNVLASDTFNLAPERKAFLPAYRPSPSALTLLYLLDKQRLEAQKAIAIEKEAEFESITASSSNATSSTRLSQCSSSFNLYRSTPSKSDSTSTGSINLDSPQKANASEVNPQSVSAKRLPVFH